MRSKGAARILLSRHGWAGARAMKAWQQSSWRCHPLPIRNPEPYLRPSLNRLLLLIVLDAGSAGDYYSGAEQMTFGEFRERLRNRRLFALIARRRNCSRWINKEIAMAEGRPAPITLD